MLKTEEEAEEERESRHLSILQLLNLNCYHHITTHHMTERHNTSLHGMAQQQLPH